MLLFFFHKQKVFGKVYAISSLLHDTVELFINANTNSHTDAHEYSLRNVTQQLYSFNTFLPTIQFPMECFVLRLNALTYILLDALGPAFNRFHMATADNLLVPEFIRYMNL